MSPMTRPPRVTLGVAIVVGLMFGPLDLAGQVNAPYPFANLFNSPAYRVFPAFAGYRRDAAIRSRTIPIVQLTPSELLG